MTSAVARFRSRSNSIAVRPRARTIKSLHSPPQQRAIPGILHQTAIACLHCRDRPTRAGRSTRNRRASHQKVVPVPQDFRKPGTGLVRVDRALPGYRVRTPVPLQAIASLSASATPIVATATRPKVVQSSSTCVLRSHNLHYCPPDILASSNPPSGECRSLCPHPVLST